MSWLSRILGIADSPPLATSPGMVASPWSPEGNLASVVVEDIAGLTDQLGYVTRAQAMLVPAVVRGRGLIAGTLSRYPLKAYKGAELVATPPAWLYRTNTVQPPRQRVLWTIDDLIFSGHSLWLVERSAAGVILDATRAPMHRWRLAANGKDVELLEEGSRYRLMDPSEYIYFAGPQDPLLSAGALAIRASLAIQKGVAARAASPVPIINLELSPDSDLTTEELAQIQRDWAVARSSEYGAVAVTQSGVNAREMGTSGSDFLEAARNAARLDIANLLGIPASELDGSVATASLTYTTAEGNRNRLHDGLEMWRTAIEDRLSADDVTPRGTRIAFDVSALIGPRDGDDPDTED